MSGKRIILILFVLVCVAGGFAYWQLTATPPAVGPAEDPTPPSADGKNTLTADTEQTRERRKLLGTWQDGYRGKRTMILNDDGTATMDVEPSGPEKFLIGRKLHFNMEWSLRGRILHCRSLSGEPKEAVNAILNSMGNTSDDTILELTDGRLLLLDKDGKTKYDWKRVKTD